MAGDVKTIDDVLVKSIRATRKRIFDVRLKNGQYQLRTKPFFDRVDTQTTDVAYKTIMVMCLLFAWEAYPFLDTVENFYGEIFERDFTEDDLKRLDTVRHNIYPELVQICFLFHTVDYDLLIRAVRIKCNQCR